MSYELPDVFASIAPGDVGVSITSPDYYPCVVGPNYLVKNKAAVTHANKSYYEGVSLAAISWPGLLKQKNNPASDLKVDIDDGIYDPVLYVRRPTGVLVDISNVTGVAFGESSITTIPANIYVDASGAAVQTPKASLSDGDMETTGVALWPSPTATTLTKDTSNQKSGSQALKAVTTNATNLINSSTITVAAGEIWKLKLALKGAHNYTVVIYDVTNGANINSDAFTGVAGYTDKEYQFTVPAGCTQIKFTIKTDSDADTYYVDDAHFRFFGDTHLEGDILVSYRALYDLYTGNYLAPLRGDTWQDLLNFFGSDGLAPANPLGYGMAKAMLHKNIGVMGISVGEPVAGDGSVAYSAGLSNELTCFASSLSLAEEQDDIFTMVACSFDRGVRDALAAHVAAQSLTAAKHERIGIGVDTVPTENIFRTGTDGLLYGRISSSTLEAGPGWTDGMTITYDGSDYAIRVVDNNAYAPLPLAVDSDPITITHDSVDYTDAVFTIQHAAGVLFLLTSVAGGNLTATGFRQVKIGDTVTIGALTYTTVSPRSDVIILGSASGTQAGGSDKTYSIKRYLTLDGLSTGIADKATMATMLKDMAESYAKENMMLMAPGYVRDTSLGQDVPSYYYGAQIAAEIAAPVDPDANGGQGQGAGYPTGVDSATGFAESTTETFKSSRYFTDAQMNIAADGGIAWIINDSPGSNVRLRHSLTTNRTSIETQEIMLVSARYLGQKLIRAATQRLIQRFRIGPGLAAALEPRLDGLANYMVNDLGIFGAVRYDEVGLDENDSTHVMISGEVEHVYPLNKLSFAMKTATPVGFSVDVG